MLKKDMKKLLIISALFSLISCVFFLSVYNNSFGFTECYSEDFKKYASNDQALEELSERAQDYEQEQEQIYTQIDSYISENQVYAKPPAVLTDELTQLLLNARFNDTELLEEEKYENLYTVISSQLLAQQTAADNINTKLIGYSRNVRRGVTDKYSLAVAQKLTESYTDILETLNNNERVYDTSAANSYLSYMSEEIMLVVGVYFLLFSIFSSEIQSRRYSSFSITKLGSKRFCMYKTLEGFTMVFIYTVINFAFVLIAMLIKAKTLDAFNIPIQYLDGYEASTENISFGKLVVVIFLLKLLYLFLLSSIVMLFSRLSRKTILSAVLSLVPVSLTYLLRNCEGKILSILLFKFESFFGDINYVNVFEYPVKIYYLYIPFMAACIFIALMVLYLLSRERSC
ncbi:MAG: hypothetical protein LUI06_08815 [Ruminococcus sp.]|nr:hypothetical protein [Ruminococcus sp.]